jgi:hypothetical protein
LTAEIAILNRSGVALAADSAVTVSSDSGRPKTFNTSNKIFRLSFHEPVGVMFYENSLMMDIPWETVIKLHRVTLGTNVFVNLYQYVEHLVTYIEGILPIQNAEKQEFIFTLFDSYFKSIKEELRDEVRYRLQTGQAVNVTIVRRLTTSIISGRRKFCLGQPVLPMFSQTNMAALETQYKGEFDRALAENFGPNELTPTARSSIEEFAFNALVRDYFSDQFSGVVIAGFGDHELFPSLYALRTDGIVDGHFKFHIEREAHITPVMRATVQAFAQGEMAARFMEGIDPEYNEYLETAIPELLTKLTERIVDSHVPGTAAKRAAIKRGIVRAGNRMIQSFEQTAAGFRRVKFVDPVIDAVGILAKEDLAETAEAMVKLTAVKRRVSLEPETVGGPIDVAVISKGDGFIWLKRKSYFDRNLNPHLAP